MDLALLTVSALLAGLAGYTAQRASICSVRAVAETIDRGEGAMLISFAKAAAWAAVVAVPLGWAIFGEVEIVAPRLSLAVLAGGLLFGVGSGLNRGCAVSTVTHLASGDAAMLTTLGGFAVGALVFAQIARQAPAMEPGGVAMLATPGVLPGAVLAFIWLWALLELRGLLSNRKSGRGRTLAFAAIGLGLCNGVLFVLQGPWAYTAAIIQGSSFILGRGVAPGLAVLVLFAALVAGAALAAWRSGRLRLRWRGERPWLHHLIGGMLMGGGAALVPGGNDAILLNAVPLLAEHALPAYAAMLLGVTATLLLSRGRSAPAFLRPARG